MKIFKILLFSIFFLILLFLGSTYLGYTKWVEEEISQNQEIVCFGSTDFSNLEIEKKIERFAISDSKTEFVTFTREEILNILATNINTGESLKFNDLCLKPGKGEWNMYIQFKLADFEVPWVVLDIAKDEMETAEIYVKEIYVGKYVIPFGLGDKIIVEINKGISDALILVNENRFLGREIRNIELLEERVIIKGSL